MRFIVDLYRNILLVLCAIILVGALLLIIAALDRSGPFGSYLTGQIILIAFATLALLVLNLGAIATLISMHDRHAELASNSAIAADALARLAAYAENQRGDVA
jgi:hypothetical protein